MDRGNDGPYVLGIDVGTSGAKVILMDAAGNSASQGYEGYRLYNEGNRVEQDSGDWWDACIKAVRQAAPGDKALSIRAISLSTQGATMTAMDRRGKPLGRALTWMDGRARAQSEKLESLLGNETIYHISGWRTSPGNDASKILWMKQNGAYRNAALYLSTLEYMNMRLTGRAVIDPTNAAIRQLFNVGSGCWDKTILEVLGISEKELPEIAPTGSLIGGLTAGAASALGITKGTPVYNGAHDQYCASIGCGAVSAGNMLVSTGTAWVLMGITETPIFSNTYIAPCPHPAKGLYGNMVSLAGAGAYYQWIRDTYLPGESFKAIDEKAAAEAPKCENLFFLPWLAGAFYPTWNPAARGGFIGMDFAVNPYAMALVVMESAVFSLNNAIKDFKAHGFTPRTIKIMGGAARSPVWLDMLTAVLDVPFYKMKITDTCALGAAFIAACGQGWYPDYAAVAAKAAHWEEVRETRADKDFYQEKSRRYTGMLSFMEKLYKNGGAL
jgi:sugar (pentulose or hexulose) kinase